MLCRSFLFEPVAMLILRRPLRPTLVMKTRPSPSSRRRASPCRPPIAATTAGFPLKPIARSFKASSPVRISTTLDTVVRVLSSRISRCRELPTSPPRHSAIGSLTMAPSPTSTVVRSIPPINLASLPCATSLATFPCPSCLLPRHASLKLRLKSSGPVPSLPLALPTASLGRSRVASRTATIKAVLPASATLGLSLVAGLTISTLATFALASPTVRQGSFSPVNTFPTTLDRDSTSPPATVTSSATLASLMLPACASRPVAVTISKLRCLVTTSHPVSTSPQFNTTSSLSVPRLKCPDTASHSERTSPLVSAPSLLSLLRLECLAAITRLVRKSLLVNATSMLSALAPTSLPVEVTSPPSLLATATISAPTSLLMDDTSMLSLLVPATLLARPTKIIKPSRVLRRPQRPLAICSLNLLQRLSRSTTTRNPLVTTSTPTTSARRRAARKRWAGALLLPSLREPPVRLNPVLPRPLRQLSLPAPPLVNLPSPATHLRPATSPRLCTFPIARTRPEPPSPASKSRAAGASPLRPRRVSRRVVLWTRTARRSTTTASRSGTRPLASPPWPRPASLLSPMAAGKPQSSS